MKAVTHFMILSVCCAVSVGCEKQPPRGESISWEKCLRELVTHDQLPSLEGRDIKMYTSHDRTGGNNDFNNVAGPGRETGWVALVDLKGPGCIRRFWTTGTDPDHPIRIYIDGEKKPRIDTTIDTLFGASAPWTPPLAQHINMCYYSYIPITYQKSIRIETKEANVHPFWGPRRLFYQIAAETFPPGSRVESYPSQFDQNQLAAAEHVNTTWTSLINRRDIVMPEDAIKQTIMPGNRMTLLTTGETGTITEFLINVQPSDPTGWSRIDQEYLLQDTILRIYYDGLTTPSVEVPLGDFFANAWRKRAYGSAWFTSGEDGYACRLPMPFTNGIRIEVENGADRDVSVLFSAKQSPLRAEHAGFLHAEYRRSGPEGGQPHVVTRINGKGKFIGCFLGVTGLDQSWWILEGDERIWVDKNTQPVWHGTGLEDYFNGGWYYRGSVFGALNANFDRAPFRVAQFRHQLPDPVTFSTFFQMEFERMNDEQTRLPVKGWFQSVAYFYLDKPMAVQVVPSDRVARRAVENPQDRPLTMLQLVELERANDFGGAKRLVEEYLERYPGSDAEGVYRLRHLEYRRFLEEPVSNDNYAPFLAGTHGTEAKKQAEQLVWFYAQPNRAIFGLNVNGRGRLLLNNQMILSGDHPFNLFTAGVELSNGTQRLAAQVEMQRAEPWLQAGVRTHSGVAGTGLSTWSSRSVQPNWRIGDIGSFDWKPTPLRDILRGVPDAPFIGGIENAFILIQSKSYPVRGLDWGYHQGTYYFRNDFEFPLVGWPTFSGQTTGLDR